MVFHGRDHDAITLAQKLPAISRGYQVDRLGRVAGDHDLFFRSRVDEAGDGLAHSFIAVGQGLAKVMRATMDVGILIFQHLAHGVDHGARLLG